MKKLLTQSAIALAMLSFASGASAKGYNEVEVTDGGSFVGTVAAGASEADTRTYTISKDPEICGEGSREVPFVEINDAGMLMNAVVFLNDVDEGKAVKVAGAVIASSDGKASLKVGPVLTDSFRIDSPVFDRLTGEFAIIRQIYQAEGYATTAIVNRRIGFTAEAGGSTAYLYVIKEEDEDRYSPALMAMVTRVPLDWH